MALAWISGRFSRPSNRADRRRRARLGDEEPAHDDTNESDSRERRRRLWSVGIGVLLLAVIFGVVAFGYYQEFFRPPRVWAGNVNNVEFNMGDLVQRIRVLQGVNRYQGGAVDLSTVPFEYLQNLINVEILRQAAPGLGIDPGDEAVERELRARFQPSPPEGQEVDPGQLEREFENNFQTFLTATGLTDEEYRVIVEEELTELGLFLLLSRDIEQSQEQVEVRWIRLPANPSDPNASGLQPEQVARRLEVEPFGVVAREVGRSAGFADSSGNVGWVPMGAFPDLDPLLFEGADQGTAALEVGELSRPFYSEEGFYIIQKTAGPEERELSDQMRLKLSLELTQAWQEDALRQGTEDGTVKMNFNSSLYAWVADQVNVTAPRVENPGQPPQ